MYLVKDDVAMMGHYDYSSMDEFEAALYNLNDKVAKLENYLVSSRIYTENKDKIYVEYEPELDDFVRCDELPLNELKAIELEMQQTDIFHFTQKLMEGFVGMVINKSTMFDGNKYYC